MVKSTRGVAYDTTLAFDDRAESRSEQTQNIRCLSSTDRIVVARLAGFLRSRKTEIFMRPCAPLEYIAFRL